MAATQALLRSSLKLWAKQVWRRLEKTPERCTKVQQRCREGRFFFPCSVPKSVELGANNSCRKQPMWKDSLIKLTLLCVWMGAAPLIMAPSKPGSKAGLSINPSLNSWQMDRLIYFLVLSFVCAPATDTPGHRESDETSISWGQWGC